tara:strand:- start:105 stop:782 length:678 start_codon:yes stop_codon:yes gene_type:complete
MILQLLSFFSIFTGTIYYCHYQHEYIKKKTNYSIEITQAITLIIHDVYLFILANLYLFKYISSYSFLNSNAVCMGYMTYDIYLQLLIKNKYQIIFHHLIMIGTYFTLFIINCGILPQSKEDLYIYVAQTSLCEISSFFLDACYIMYKLNYDKNIIFKFMYIMLLITYFISRLINFPYIAYLMYNNGDIYYGGFQISLLTILSYYWFYLLYKRFIESLKINNKKNN